MRSEFGSALVACAGVGGGMFLLFHVLGMKSLQQRRTWCVVHHVAVSLLALWGHPSALLLEVGFEVADTVWSACGAGWTGLRGFPVYMHHALSAALGLYFFHLVHVRLLVFSLVAPLLPVFVGGGACDLLWAKLLPTRRHSAAQYVATAIYSLCFLFLRCYLFLSHALPLLAALSSAALSVRAVAYAAFVLFALYHSLLALGVAFAWKHGGRMPEKKVSSSSSE